MKSQNLKKTPIFLLKILISSSLIFFIFRSIDFNRILTVLGDIDYRYFLTALIITTVNLIIGAYRWKVILKVGEIDLQFKNILSLYFVGFFFNTFVPGNIGGDILRGYDVRQVSGKSKESFISVLMDRFIALFSLVLVCLVSCFFSKQVIANKGIFFFILGFFSISSLALIFFLNSNIMRKFGFVLKIFNHRNMDAKIKEAYHHILDYKGRKDIIVPVFLISVFSHIVLILSIYILSLSISSTVSIKYFFLFVPIIIFLSMIPITISGLGIREGGFAYFFAIVGMPKESALLISLLLFTLLVLNGLFGGMIYIFRNLSPSIVVNTASTPTPDKPSKI